MSDTNASLRNFLQLRLDDLSRCNSKIAHELLNPCANGDIERIEITFRYSMLVSVCTFFEEALKVICSKALPGYQEPRHDVIAHHKKLLKEDGRVDLASAECHWKKMADIFVIRNCIAHHWGKVDRCDIAKRSRIEQILCEEQKIDEANRLFNKTPDGYVLPTDTAVPAAINASRTIVDRLLVTLLPERDGGGPEPGMYLVTGVER